MRLAASRETVSFCVATRRTAMISRGFHGFSRTPRFLFRFFFFTFIFRHRCESSPIIAVMTIMNAIFSYVSPNDFMGKSMRYRPS